MVPVELVLRNFMCYRGDMPPLRFDGLHVACLSGENGAGKSALLDAMTWALWGKARMSDDELIAQNEQDMLVDLTFELNNQVYRVARRRQINQTKKRSSKGWLDLHVRDGEAWKAIGATTTTETERIIESLLRMRYDTFINASFLIQGRADEFTRRTPAERKQVLADILDLRDYAVLEERAKQRTNTLKAQVGELDGIIGHLQQEADKREIYEQLTREAQQRVDDRHTKLQTSEHEKAKTDEHMRQLETKLARRKEIGERLQVLQQDIQQQEREIADLHTAITSAETLLQQRDMITEGVAALATAQRTLAHLDALRPRYDELVDQRRHHQEDLKDVRRTLQSELDGHQREVDRLRKQIEQRPALQAELDKQIHMLDALTPLTDRLSRLHEQQTAVNERISRINTLLIQQRDLANQISQRQRELEAERKQHQRDTTRLEEQMKPVASWRTELATVRTQQQTIQEVQDRLMSLRQSEHATSLMVGELRANCTQYTQHADEIKTRQTLLQDTEQTTCPLCHSDLGTDGIARVAASYEHDLKDLRQRYVSAKQEAEAQESSLVHLREDIGAHEDQLAALQHASARVEWIQQQLVLAEHWQAELQRVQAALHAVEQQLASGDYEREAREALLTCEDELADLGAQKQKSKKGDHDQWTAAPVEQERKTLQQQQRECERQLEPRSSIEGQIATLRHRLDALDQEVAQLPASEQQIAQLQTILETGDYGHEIRIAGRAVEAEMAELGYSADAHDAARASLQKQQHWAEQEQALKLAESTLERDKKALQRTTELLKRYTDDRDTLQSEDAVLEQDVRVYPAVQQQARQCTEAVAQSRRELDMANHDLSEQQTLLNKAQESAEQLGQKQAERQALAERQGIYKELAEACGKKGVQAMLIETAIPEIERDANRLLGRITDNQMHVTFDMQRSTKKGDTVETLDIKIADTLGTRAYDSFSGGETMRINFAIRVALSRLLARRAGASLETLVIDEGFGTLDADGRERFVEAITSVQDDFKRILVVTHIDDLKDRFPAQIQITKGTAGSRWELV